MCLLRSPQKHSVQVETSVIVIRIIHNECQTSTANSCVKLALKDTFVNLCAVPKASKTTTAASEVLLL